MKWLKRLGITTLLVTILAFFGIQGLFAVDNNLRATAPTTKADGAPLTDLTSMRVYKARLTPPATDCATATYAVLATVPFAEEGGQFTYLDANQTQNGRYCYKVTSIRANGNESAFSNVAFKDVDLVLPSAPTNLTVD